MSSEPEMSNRQVDGELALTAKVAEAQLLIEKLHTQLGIDRDVFWGFDAPGMVLDSIMVSRAR